MRTLSAAGIELALQTGSDVRNVARAVGEWLADRDLL